MFQSKTIYYGGSFDPPTLGHLQTAQNASEEFDAKIVFLPTWGNPFKNKQTDFETRYEMVLAAIKDNPDFEVSFLERTLMYEGKAKDDKIYTCDVVAHLYEQFGHKPNLLIGEDCLRGISNWKNYKYVIENAKLYVAKRHEYDAYGQIVERAYPEILDEIQVEWLFQEPIHLSSSLVRDRVRDEKNITYMVHPSTHERIYNDKMYGIKWYFNPGSGEYEA